MIVDTHVHVVAGDRKKYPQTRDIGRAGIVPTVHDMGQPEWPVTNVESLMEMMDRAGVDRALLVQAYYTYEYDNSYAIDAALAYPKRFKSVVVLDPMLPETPSVMTEMVEKKGVRGIRLQHGRRAGSTLDNPVTFPVWERARDLKVPVAIGDRFENYPKLKVVIEKFPQVPVALDHIWGNEVSDPPYDMLAPLFDLAVFPNVYIKTAVNNSYAAREGKSTPHQFYARLVEVFGAKRLMWGSNFPAHPVKFKGYEDRVKVAREDFAFMNEADRNWIFGETALSIYRDVR